MGKKDKNCTALRSDLDLIFGRIRSKISWKIRRIHLLWLRMGLIIYCLSKKVLGLGKKAHALSFLYACQYTAGYPNLAIDVGLSGIQPEKHVRPGPSYDVIFANYDYGLTMTMTWEFDRGEL